MLELKIPPPIYMLLVAGLMWLLDKNLPVIELLSSPWNKLGFVFMAVAAFLDGSAVLQFFRTHTTINPLRPEKAEKLVITGMYRYSRNPMYVGLLFLLVGWAILLGSLSVFIMLPLFMWILTIQQIIPEEKILEQKFGKEYIQYKETVNRWF